MSTLQIGTIDFQYNTPSQFMNFPTAYDASINWNILTLLKVIQIHWSVVLICLVCIIRSQDLFKPRIELPDIRQWACNKLLLSNQWENIFWVQMINWRFYMTKAHHGQLWANHQLCLWSCNNVFQLRIWKQYHINMNKCFESMKGIGRYKHVTIKMTK